MCMLCIARNFVQVKVRERKREYLKVNKVQTFIVTQLYCPYIIPVIAFPPHQLLNFIISCSAAILKPVLVSDD